MPTAQNRPGRLFGAPPVPALARREAGRGSEGALPQCSRGTLEVAALRGAADQRALANEHEVCPNQDDLRRSRVITGWPFRRSRRTITKNSKCSSDTQVVGLLLFEL